MKNVHRVFTAGHYLVSHIFVAAAFILIAFAVYEIVLLVALSIEALVAVFQFLHEYPVDLDHAASIGYLAAALLAAWGVFLWFNRTVEQLEPEAV